MKTADTPKRVLLKNLSLQEYRNLIQFQVSFIVWLLDFGDDDDTENKTKNSERIKKRRIGNRIWYTLRNQPIEICDQLLWKAL